MENWAGGPGFPFFSVPLDTRGWPILAEKLAFSFSASPQGWDAMMFPSRFDLCVPLRCARACGAEEEQSALSNQQSAKAEASP